MRLERLGGRKKLFSRGLGGEVRLSRNRSRWREEWGRRGQVREDIRGNHRLSGLRMIPYPLLTIWTVHLGV